MLSYGHERKSELEGINQRMAEERKKSGRVLPGESYSSLIIWLSLQKECYIAGTEEGIHRNSCEIKRERKSSQPRSREQWRDCDPDQNWILINVSGGFI